jgi:hypothetical protein
MSLKIFESLKTPKRQIPQQASIDDVSKSMQSSPSRKLPGGKILSINLD